MRVPGHRSGYHVEEHCATPRVFMRRIGSLWLCNCGTLYVLELEVDWDGSTYKVWQKIHKFRKAK